MGSSDDKILSYNDVVLRRSDLEILGGPHFLNDRIIEFYFSFLSSSYPSEEILLVPPAIAFWIANCPDKSSLRDFIEPLKLADRKLVMFAVNDNEDVSRIEGGSHWSVLIYERNKNVFVHHDSSRGLNDVYALQLYNAVVEFIGASVRPQLTGSKDSPQQMNGYDCGLYVTATTRAICNWFASWNRRDGDELWFSTVQDEVTPQAVSQMRNEILDLIKSLMYKK